MCLGIDHARILNSIQTPILVINLEYLICDFNQAFSQTYGVTRDNALGRPCHEIAHKSSIPCWENGITCPVKTVIGDIKSSPCRIIHKHILADGNPRWEEIVATSLMDAQGHVSYVIEELHDMSELLQSREILDELKKELKMLKGLLPMCSNCLKIRDEEGNWHRVDNYIRKHSEALVSHGLCPECVKILYPKFSDHE